jgi:hypothetical protein
LLSAKVGPIKELLQTENLDFFLGRLLDELKMFVDHRLLDFRPGVIGPKHIPGLNQATANYPRHKDLRGTHYNKNRAVWGSPSSCLPVGDNHSANGALFSSVLLPGSDIPH